MRLMRDLARRKLRTGLTILGISIGIWTLVVFGSMGNKISALVEGGSSYYANKIIVSDASGAAGGFASVPIPMSTADALQGVDGVAVVVPEVMLLLDEQSSGAAMGIPPMIVGSVAGADGGRETFDLTMAQGRSLTAADEGHDVTVLGADLARKYEKAVGDTIELRGEPFTVVGILEPTLTAPDQEAMVPLEAAQRLIVASLPPMVGASLSPADVATMMVVYPDAGADPETVAARVRAQVPDVATMTGKDFDQQVGSATAMLNAILIGIALISLIVGGLSVINTMAMSVAERTREIGIKRAIGGSRSRIVRELVIEAGLIGLIGGAIGLGLGAAVVTALNEAGRSSGTVLFDLTGSTAFTALAFATVLGALAGFAPAVHAARLDPVTALRYE